MPFEIKNQPRLGEVSVMAAHQKIRLGVIGAGRWGPNLIRNFQTDATSQVVWVAEKSKERLALIRERYGDSVRATENADEVLRSPDVDAVVICTPTVTHYELAREAIKNGKHVFVEKPLATNVAHCDELIEAAKKRGVVLFVGHVFVYNAGIQAVGAKIRAGDLGRIYHLQITRTNLGPIRSDVSALWDLASHDISILHYWLGEMPLSVSAVGGCYLNSRLEDCVFATYRFRNDVLANVHVSWLNPKKVREITIVGEKKMLVWDDMKLDRPVHVYDKNVTIDPLQADRPAGSIVDTFTGFRASIHEGETTVADVKPNEPLAAECRAFLGAIHEPASSLSTGEHGRAVVEALLATDESLRQRGAEIRIQYRA